MTILSSKTFCFYVFLLLCSPLFISCDDSDPDSTDNGDSNDDKEEEIQSYAFEFDNVQYEVVAENLTWEEAVEYAVGKGGKLAEINSVKEQEAIFNELIDKSNIDFEKSQALESNSAKVWIGGTDAAEEGKWIWDGDNDGSGIHFWQGDFWEGAIVDGQYSNWGSGREPDNWSAIGQHALAIGMTNWIYGTAGQWNDLQATNKLYFIIEYDNN